MYFVVVFLVVLVVSVVVENKKYRLVVCARFSLIYKYDEHKETYLKRGFLRLDLFCFCFCFCLFFVVAKSKFFAISIKITRTHKLNCPFQLSTTTSDLCIRHLHSSKQ